jgi:2-polyprenyl-3-methyl-5-hydroxy-6-metoxy-1,4-benzoquinol methylase
MLIPPVTLDFMSTLRSTLIGMSTSTPASTSRQGLIAVLDVVDDLPGASEVRERTYQLLAATPGECVVDVGCGTGRAVGEMHQRGVRAVGVDIDETMLAVARERWPASPFLAR